MTVERSRYEDLELTADQVTELAGAFKDLVASHAWQLLVDLIKGRKIQYRELLTRGSKDDFDRVVGLVAGLEEAVELPYNILQLGNVIVQREEAQLARPRRRHPEYQLADSGGPTFS